MAKKCERCNAKKGINTYVVGDLESIMAEEDWIADLCKVCFKELVELLNQFTEKIRMDKNNGWT